MTTLTSPHDLLAAIPFLIGYHPEDSLVVVSIKDNAVGMAMRIDYPVDIPEGAYDLLASHLQRDSATGALLVAYVPGERSDGEVVLTDASAALTRISIATDESLLIQGGRYRSVLCQDQGCCPAEGNLIPEIDGSRIAVEHVVAEVLEASGGVVATSSKSKAAGKATPVSSFIRVPSDKLDALINLVGELVIANAGTVEQAKHLNHTAMLESTSAVAGLIEEIRDGALGLRMVQIGETFQRFQRVVRDTAMGLGKQIQLEISGEDTELDKSVVEKIGDPLMHLVRNALDHGLETPEERVAAGKAATGKLQLNAYHDSGHIVIEVNDDGRGLAREKILKKAIEKGIVSPEQVLSDAEVNMLIFAPGFSTADKVTDISGRGVGMDVVKRNIEALRGSVQVRSRPGNGCTFEIRLPLTLAIIDGFMIGVGGSVYVIPLSYVRECLELPVDALGTDDRMDIHYDLRGEFLPAVRLRKVFHPNAKRPKRENIIVVSFGGMKAGIVADQLHGESQTVIKPLGNLFEQNRAISGATIMGNGDVALIIDVPKLITEVSSITTKTAELEFSRHAIEQPAVPSQSLEQANA